MQIPDQIKQAIEDELQKQADYKLSEDHVNFWKNIKGKTYGQALMRLRNSCIECAVSNVTKTFNQWLHREKWVIRCEDNHSANHHGVAIGDVIKVVNKPHYDFETRRAAMMAFTRNLAVQSRIVAQPLRA